MLILVTHFADGTKHANYGIGTSMTDPPKSKILPNLVLETKRCILRYPSHEDSAAMLTAFNSTKFPRDLPLGLITCLEEVHNWINHCQTGWAEGNIYSWVVEQKYEHTLLGQVTLARLNEPDTWSLAYWIHPKHWGQGYATEAAQMVLKFGTEKLNVTKFWAGTAKWNTPSERVLEKLGMLHVSDNPQGYNIKGKPIPTKEFELTLP
jgi:ribosomal-protein-alanine N-acetyltransferase